MSRIPKGTKTSLKEVARKAQVSLSTASVILNQGTSTIPISDGTRQRVLRIADEIGYVPNHFARALRQQRSRIIGVAVGELPDRSFGEVFHAIEQVLQGDGYMVMVGTARCRHDRMDSVLAEFHGVGVDGILVIDGPRGCIPYHGKEWDIATSESGTIADRPGPIVVVGTDGTSQASSVSAYNARGGEAAMTHLLSLGREEIYYVGGEQTQSAAERLLGARRAVSNNLKKPLQLIETGATALAGYRSTRHLFTNAQRSKAVFAENDHVALGVIRAAKDAGLDVPGDVAVVGYGDSAFASFVDPRLTTVRQPYAELGRRAADLLLRHMSGGRGSQELDHVVLRPELVIRESA